MGGNSMADILIISAHPDDEVLGCGGVIARSIRIDNQDVYIAYLSYGAMARRPGEDMDDLEKEKIKDRSRAAISVLMGVSKSDIKKHLRFVDFPDNQFDTVPFINIVRLIEELIDELQPDCIFTHSQKDLNIDHVITHRAVLTATRPMKDKHRVSAIYTFPIPSSTEWAFSSFGSFSPNVFFDIATFTELKIRALKCYDTEVRAFPHPRSVELIQVMACFMGSSVGMGSAEGFEVVRCLI
jgi:LmbE family N-acetylglucosaminyl deacetylase